MQLARQTTRPGALTLAALGLLAVLLTATGPAHGQTPPSDITPVILPAPVHDEADGTVTVSIPIGRHAVIATEDGDRIGIGGFGRRLVPGVPNLPSRIVAVAIPPGAEVVGVRFDPGEARVLEGTYNVPPVPAPGVIGPDDPVLTALRESEFDANYAAVYGSDEAFPASTVEFVRRAGYRGYNLVDLRINPVSYRPISQELTRYSDIMVHVDYRSPDEVLTVATDSSPRIERMAERIVLNHAQTSEWYPEVSLRGGEHDVHDYVIITLESLTDAVQPLVEWESAKGRSVEVVTTEWIAATYPGYDLAEKMRNFLREKYTAFEWAVEDVLLVGHYDDVPMRRIAQDVGYGRPETDFYYAELSEADGDSWDADGDHQWGETSDPVDLYAEIQVGRIPWSDAGIVRHICEKSIAYEQIEDETFKKNILLLGAYYWADTDNAELMEAKVDQLWMADWTTVRMYEQNSTYHSSYECDYPLDHDNVMDILPTGRFAFVNYAGHGSPTSCHIAGHGSQAFIQSSDCTQLDDEYPAIMFAAACSNSDTDHVNIGQAMMERGAVGFLGSTKVAFGVHGWSDPYDGATASMDYFFTTCVTSNDYTIGAAHQFALVEMYTHGLWYYELYETFEWGALWGNPNLGMAPAIFLGVTFPNGVPEYLAPREDFTFTVEITNGTDEYVPDTAKLHYRYDGGDWLESDLVPLGDDLFEAMLPATGCGTTPEFYISAEGVTSGVMTRPYGAPADDVFTAEVATVTTAIDDDFNYDQGWTVESEDIMAGEWDRGIPVGDPARGVPSADADGSGLCYVTDNRSGNFDVDGGPTHLISPTFDLSGVADPVLSYARWFYNDDLDEDRLVIEISNDDGANWTLIESVGYFGGTPEWVDRSYHVADLIDLTEQVKVRFTVADNPNNSVTEAGVDGVKLVDICCVTPASGDVDHDGDVDLDDFATFPACLSGPATELPPRCEVFDFDGDTDVDVDDFAAFQGVFGT